MPHVIAAAVSGLVKSGRDGRMQIIYRVPEQYWDAIVTRKYKTGVIDAKAKPSR